MNKDQVTGIGERVLYGVVTYFTAQAVAKGWIDGEMASYIATGAVSLIGGAWAWWINRPTALLRAAAQQNPDTKMVAPDAIAKSTPETNIVSKDDNKVMPK